MCNKQLLIRIHVEHATDLSQSDVCKRLYKVFSSTNNYDYMHALEISLD